MSGGRAGRAGQAGGAGGAGQAGGYPRHGVLASLAGAFRIDRGGLRPTAATKATVGVVLPLIAGVAVGQPAAGATAAFGALSVGNPLITAGPRTPVRTMLAASFGMAAATFVGSVTGLVPAVHLVTLAVAGFAAGLLVAAGRGATQVGINATIALLVFGRLAAYPGAAAVHASWVLGGGLLQTGLAVAIRSPRRLGGQRIALAAGYEALAEGATRSQLPVAVTETVASAEDAIGPWMQAGDRPQAATLRGLADELDRIRQEIHALHLQRGVLSADGQDRRAVDQALADVAEGLGDIGAALRHGEPAVIEPVAARLVAGADLLTADTPAGPAGPGGPDGPGRAGGPDSPGRAGGPDGPGRASGTAGPGAELAARYCGARISALAGQLRAVGRMVTELAGVRRVTLPVAAATVTDAIVVTPSELLSVLRRLRAATVPSSPAFRHAVRLAVVLPVATVLSGYLPWQRGYWLAVTAAIVLKPDFAATVSRGVARIIGTGVGVLVAALLIAAAHPQGAVLTALIAACAWLGYTVLVANYAIFAFFLTTLVILLVAAAQASAISAVENRGFDTLLGGGLAIAAYLIWPTWEARTLQSATADRFEAIARYLTAVLGAYVHPGSDDQRELARLAAATRRSQSVVMASLERARGEPARSRPDVGQYGGELAAGRRIVIGTHALASHLNDAQRQVAVPAGAGIAAQLDEAMTAVTQAIRTGEPPGPLPDLRHAQRRLTIATSAAQTPADRRGAVLAALLDPVVDAIDTAAALLKAGQHPPAAGPPAAEPPTAGPSRPTG